MIRSVVFPSEGFGCVRARRTSAVCLGFGNLLFMRAERANSVRLCCSDTRGKTECAIKAEILSGSLLCLSALDFPPLTHCYSAEPLALRLSHKNTLWLILCLVFNQLIFKKKLLFVFLQIFAYYYWILSLSVCVIKLLWKTLKGAILWYLLPFAYLCNCSIPFTQKPFLLWLKIFGNSVNLCSPWFA